jgi:hypothetical protein
LKNERGWVSHDDRIKNLVIKTKRSIIPKISLTKVNNRSIVIP